MNEQQRREQQHRQTALGAGRNTAQSRVCALAVSAQDKYVEKQLQRLMGA